MGGGISLRCLTGWGCVCCSGRVLEDELAVSGAPWTSVRRVQGWGLDVLE